VLATADVADGERARPGGNWKDSSGSAVAAAAGSGGGGGSGSACMDDLPKSASSASLREAHWDGHAQCWVAWVWAYILGDQGWADVCRDWQACVACILECCRQAGTRQEVRSRVWGMKGFRAHAVTRTCAWIGMLIDRVSLCCGGQRLSQHMCELAKPTAVGACAVMDTTARAVMGASAYAGLPT